MPDASNKQILYMVLMVKTSECSTKCKQPSFSPDWHLIDEGVKGGFQTQGRPEQTHNI